MTMQRNLNAGLESLANKTARRDMKAGFASISLTGAPKQGAALAGRLSAPTASTIRTTPGPQPVPQRLLKLPATAMSKAPKQGVARAGSIGAPARPAAPARAHGGEPARPTSAAPMRGEAPSRPSSPAPGAKPNR